jgi:hypothetical protein
MTQAHRSSASQAQLGETPIRMHNGDVQGVFTTTDVLELLRGLLEGATRLG